MQYPLGFGPCPYRGCSEVIDERVRRYCERHTAIYQKQKDIVRRRISLRAEERRRLRAEGRLG